jgi:ribosome-associated heat shock protein Hsp15
VLLVQSPVSVRIDKWLWAVRLYRSRSLATAACAAGHVHIAQVKVKPSRAVQPGEIITALVGRVHRTVRVVALLEQRVGAKLVPQFLEDLTPAAEYDRAREQAQQAALQFPAGFGRPTKKQRRQLLGLLDL